MEMETLADVVFLVEGSAANGAYINELKTNYIVPTLEHFSQGPIEDREYLISERYSTLYCIVVYRTAANLLEPSCTTFGPYASPQKVIDLFERLPLVGGGMESFANLAEGLATAHVCFDDMKEHRARYNKEGNVSTQKHCILMCNSPPYSMPVMECWKFTGKTVEQLAGLFHERKINLSIIAPRKIPLLFKIFMKADGDQPLTAKKYAKNIRHLVLLKGYHLKERPQSPNSVAAAMGNQSSQVVVGGNQQQQQQQQQKNVQQQQQNTGIPMDNSHVSPQQQLQQQQQQVVQMAGIHPNQQPGNAINQQILQQQQQQQFNAQNPMQNPNFQGQTNRWVFNPNQQQSQNRPQFLPNAPGGSMVPMAGSVNQGSMSVQNSALLSQLSAPPNQNVNPMLQQQQIRMQMMNQQQQMQQLQQQQQQQNVMNSNMSGPVGTNPQQQQVPVVGSNQPNTSLANQQNPGTSSDQTHTRNKIWSGTLEWVEKSKPDQQKIPRTLQCTVTANIKDGEPEIKAINWPPKLLMQLMPKHLVGNIGGQFLKDSKMVVFNPQPCEALDALAKNMTTIFAGCVHFTTPPNMPACDIKVLILLYTAEKNAFLGFIPNNQSMFVERLRKVIQQKQSMGVQQTAGGGPNSMQQQQQQQNQQQIQNPMAGQISNNMNSQQQQQDPSQQQQHFNQYNPQQQMNLQMAGGPMNQQMMGGPPMSGGPDQMVVNNPMQQQQQMTMMQHQRMPMMTGGNPNNPQQQQQQMPAQQMSQRMVRPMMNNNSGLRHLLQQQSTPGQQFRPQMGGVGAGPGGVPMGSGGMPNPNQMSGGPGGPGGGPNRPFDENNFEYI